MYTRNVKPHEQEWLLDSLTQVGFDDGVSFRARQYIIAVDGGSRVGFGKLRKTRAEECAVIEYIYCNPESDVSQVRSVLFEGLLDFAEEEGYKQVFFVGKVPPKQLPFHSCRSETVCNLELDDFEQSKHEKCYEIGIDDWRECKSNRSNQPNSLTELASEFGYDETATTKYSVNASRED